MSILLDTYYNITETQANYYDKVATDSLFSNIDLSNYYSKTEADDIGNGLSTLILNTYTKTEIDTQLTDYTSITYLQDNYMTTLSITEALMNNYASITLLVDNFYDKAYLYNQFSLKADESEPTEHVTTAYLTTKHTNSVDLSTDSYNKTATACYYPIVLVLMLIITFALKQTPENLLADKLTNIGDIDSPGMLDIGTSGYTNSRIRCNAAVNGYTGYAELRAAPSYDMYLNLSTTRTDGGWMYFKINNDDYIQLPGSDNKVNVYKGAALSRNVDVGKVLTLKRIPGVSDTTPLVIINDSPGGATVATYTSTASNQGCVSFWTTAASTTPWMTGVIWGGLNEFVIWNGYSNNGLTLKPTGDTSISGINLDVGPSQAVTSIKAYVNHDGHQGNVEIKAVWSSQGYVNFDTTYPDGLLLTATKDVLYLYCGLNIIYFYKPTTNASDDRLKENEELIENACETLRI